MRIIRVAIMLGAMSTASRSISAAQSPLPELNIRAGVVYADNTGAHCASHRSWNVGGEARTRGQWFVAVSAQLLGPATSPCALYLPIVTYKGASAGHYREGGLNYDYALIVGPTAGGRASLLELSVGAGLMRASSIEGYLHPAAMAEARIRLRSRLGGYASVGAVRAPVRDRFVSMDNHTELGVEHRTKWPALLSAGVTVRLN